MVSRIDSRQSSIDLGDLVIDPGAHTVILDGNEMDLAPREFDLLTALPKKLEG